MATAIQGNTFKIFLGLYIAVATCIRTDKTQEASSGASRRHSSSGFMS